MWCFDRSVLDGGSRYILKSILLGLGVFHGSRIFQTAGAARAGFGREGRSVHQEATPGFGRQIRYQGGRPIESLAHHRAAGTASPWVAGIDPRSIGRGMKKAEPDTGEIKCNACDGRGYPPAKEAAPGRRIYSGRCQNCGGKGRLTKPGKSKSSAAARVRR